MACIRMHIAVAQGGLIRLITLCPLQSIAGRIMGSHEINGRADLINNQPSPTIGPSQLANFVKTSFGKRWPNVLYPLFSYSFEEELELGIRSFCVRIFLHESTLFFFE